MNSAKMVLADALAAHNTVERTIEFNVFGVESRSCSLLEVKLEKKKFGKHVKCTQPRRKALGAVWRDNHFAQQKNIPA